MFKIVKYKLNLDGKLMTVQPYQTIEAMGCTLDGGYYTTGMDCYILGYVTGSTGDVIDAAISACGRYSMSVITENQGILFANTASPPGLHDPLTDLYLHPAAAVNGRIIQAWSASPAEYSVSAPSNISMSLTPLSSTARSAYTAAIGEIILDTTDHKLYYGDGNTAGGVAV